MAGEPGNLTIEFYPTTAIFSAVLTDTSSTVSFTQNDCRVAQNYLIYETSEIALVVPTSLTVTAYGHQYNIPISDNTTVVNLPTQNLYAWKNTTYYDKNDASKPLILYTLSETPTTSDTLYTSTGEVWDGECWTGYQYGETANAILSVDNNTIVIGSTNPKGK